MLSYTGLELFPGGAGILRLAGVAVVTVTVDSVLVDVLVVVIARSATLGSGILDAIVFVLALLPALGLFSSFVVT